MLIVYITQCYQELVSYLWKFGLLSQGKIGGKLQLRVQDGYWKRVKYARVARLDLDKERARNFGIQGMRATTCRKRQPDPFSVDSRFMYITSTRFQSSLLVRQILRGKELYVNAIAAL